MTVPPVTDADAVDDTAWFAAMLNNGKGERRH